MLALSVILITTFYLLYHILRTTTFFVFPSIFKSYLKIVATHLYFAHKRTETNMKIFISCTISWTGEILIYLLRTISSEKLSQMTKVTQQQQKQFPSEARRLSTRTKSFGRTLFERPQIGDFAASLFPSQQYFWRNLHSGLVFVSNYVLRRKLLFLSWEFPFIEGNISKEKWEWRKHCDVIVIAVKLKLDF